MSELKRDLNLPPKHWTKFIDIFSEAVAANIEPNELDAQIERQLDVVRRQQGTYQPIYGIDSDQDSPRRDRLLQNCDFVEKHFSSTTRKQHIRILDVGSNAGFVTFTLAKTFPQVLGAEIDPAAMGLSSLLAQKMSSPAKFASIDILKMIDSGDVDLENIDCVLLFNVVHQMIFSRGLSYVQTVLKKIVQSVDVVFVELATRDEYVPHKKDHLLPIEAQEVFNKCNDCDIQLLRVLTRPLYLIRRRTLRLCADSFPFDSVSFSANESKYVSRKYYLNSGEFLKLYRFTPEQDHTAFRAEVAGLLALQGKMACPEILDWGKGEYCAYIRMERIYGPRLYNRISCYDTQVKVNKVIAELLRIAYEVARTGNYQNDFSAHNMIVTSDGSLRLIDFELYRPGPLYDPFAFFLWIVSDILTKRPISYERNIFQKLSLLHTNRVHHEFYPDKSILVEAGLDREFIDEVYSSGDWAGFLDKWHPRFNSLSKNEI